MKKIGIAALMLLLCACAKTQEGQDPATCEDGEDNDLDGRMDCADDGCAASTFCVNAAREAAAARAAAEKERAMKSREKQAQKVDDGPVFELDGLSVVRAESSTDVNWAEAEAYCKNLNLLGQDDWRLPDADEAVKIVESGRLNGESSYVMWTATRKGAKRAVIVGMSGAVNDLGIQYRGQCRARCVRGAAKSTR